MTLGATTRRISAFAGDAARTRDDAIAVEEPLEIRAAGRAVSVTMRTPGHDAELAVGFLFTEGLLRDRADLVGVRASGAHQNTLEVDVSASAAARLSRVTRSFYVASSCGICGKGSIDAIRTLHGIDLDDPVTISSAQILDLPERLRRVQGLFDATGGLHAAALFDASGALVTAREDVGRHNAVDKVIGERLLAGRLPAAHHVLMVSGRASFELVQKAAMARIPVLAAVGAPSSLAIDLAEEVGLTLIGFVRDRRFNVYAGDERVRRAAPAARPRAVEPSASTTGAVPS
jgi:FdhD protein